jgi:hypothetical protein
LDHADRNAAKNIKDSAQAQIKSKTAGPAGTKVHNSTGKRKPILGRKVEGGSVKPTTHIMDGGVA